jgi:hypothetical protein
VDAGTSPAEHTGRPLGGISCYEWANSPPPRFAPGVSTVERAIRMVADHKWRIKAGEQQLAEAIEQEDLIEIVGIGTMLDHLRTQCEDWQRMLRQAQREGWGAPATPARTHAMSHALRHHGSRLDRRLGCPRPAARRTSSPSATRAGPGD